MTLTVTEYAIRRKGTQMYLPRPQRRDGRGGSWYEPMDFSLPRHQRGGSSRFAQNMQIRTFSELRAAKIFLESWLRGRFLGDDEGDVWAVKVPTRHREDMEIVEITLVLPQ
jgi:hypothetical protein